MAQRSRGNSNNKDKDLSKIDSAAAESYSYSGPTYNSWQYGDEASLYSIAEDSREDRASEVPSMAGTENASIANQRHGIKSEMQWESRTGAEQIVESESAASSMGGSSLSGATFYGYSGHMQNSRRKYIIATCIVGAFLVAIISVVAVSLSNNDTSSERPSVGGSPGVQGQPKPVPAPVPASNATSPPILPFLRTPAPQSRPQRQPTEAPLPDPVKPRTKAPSSPLEVAWPSPSPTKTIPKTTSPTEAPTYSAEYRLAEGLVYNALRLCPGANYLADPTTPQGKIYKNLLTAILAKTSVEQDGFINYPLDYGNDYLRERYALEMLFQATDGDQWANNTLWGTDTDPCSGWFGINDCKTRREGSCGILGIDLDENNLVGELPNELCCLPCVESLTMAGNQLSGSIPSCLSQMNAVLDFKNNLLGSFGTTATERSESP